MLAMMVSTVRLAQWDPKVRLAMMARMELMELRATLVRPVPREKAFAR